MSVGWRALMLLGWAGVAGAANAPAALTPADLVRLERISEVAAAPDGHRVAYSQRTTDLESGTARTAVWVLDARRQAEPVRVTDAAASAGAAAWSSDGRYLYYLSNRGGTTQVWRSDLGRGAAGESSRQVTTLPLDVGSFRVAPASDRIVVSLEVYPDCKDLACTKARLDASAHLAAHGEVHDKLFVRHWDQWSDGRRSQLFALGLDPSSGLAAGPAVNVTGGIDGDVPGRPFGGREDYAISPDGRRVAFSVRIAAGGEPWSTNFDIYEAGLDGTAPRNLTGDNPAADMQPAYSPDGTQLAYLAMDRPGFEADRAHLVLLDVRSGAKRPLTHGWDRSISSFAWAPDGRGLVATTDHLGQHPLWWIDATTGRAAAITGDGDVEGFSVAPSRVFYTHSSLAAPADLFSVGFGGGSARELTHINQAMLAHRRLSAYEQFNFAGWHGESVFGYVVKPSGFERGRKYPVAFVVHGGPQGSLANVWHWRWNAQTLAGAGYAVVMIDFHGSTGYGQAFTDSISGDWGGKPLDDLKLGLAAALERYRWLDAGRMCALGGSYGGYMMNLIEGRWTDRFKCIVSHDGIFDNRSMYYSTEELWFPEWENGGPEYANPAAYARSNPVDYVKNWRTPMLVVHGQLDFRVPYEQGLAVFTALQRRGVPSELLYFPDENHWVLKPANSVQWYETVIAWMNRWTRP